LAPWVPALWLRRADALVARGWPSDALWALRDADTALTLNDSLRASQRTGGGSSTVHGAHEWRHDSGTAAFTEEPIIGPSRADMAANVRDVLRWRPHLVRARALHALGQPQSAVGALVALEVVCPDAAKRKEVQEVRQVFVGWLAGWLYDGAHTVRV
jgi:hypothetical protein